MTSGHSGGMAVRAKPSRARNLTELYVRAYWRHYATAATWVGVISLAWPWGR